MEKFANQSEVPKDHSNKEVDKTQMTRRGFLRKFLATTGNTAVGLGVGKTVLDNMSAEAEIEELGNYDSSKVEAVDRIPEESERFWNEVSGYFAQTQLRYDEIQFVDAENIPVGPPVPFADFIVDRERINDNGETETFPYRLAPGPVNDIGMATEGIAGEWIAHVKGIRQEEHPNQEIIKQVNVAKEFINAYNLATEPELRERIEVGEVVRYIDLVTHFSEKPTVGAERLNRREYVQTAIEFAEYDPETATGIPPVVEAELRRLIPGLCAQESKFNAMVTSPAGARGIFQFMPDTWEQYGGDPAQTTSLQAQVEVAGKFFSDLYKDVQHFIGEDSLQTVHDLFANETAFQRDFLVPCIINAYNAGARRVGEGVAQFISTQEEADLPVGKDLFRQATHFMESSNQGVLDRYRKHAQAYTAQVYAQAHALTILHST